MALPVVADNEAVKKHLSATSYLGFSNFMAAMRKTCIAMALEEEDSNLLNRRETVCCFFFLFVRDGKGHCAAWDLKIPNEAR